MVKISLLLKKSRDLARPGTFHLENEAEVEVLAWESGYYRQAAKKISAHALVQSFFAMVQEGKNSLRSWAVHLGKGGVGTVRKSSVAERLNSRTLNLVQAMLKRILEGTTQQIRAQRPRDARTPLLHRFRQVLIGDSTCAKLPAHLASVFPSSYSHGAPTATVRVQTLYNYSSERFEHFAIGSFRDNDQSATDLILRVAQRGDLVLRDLGYFVLDNLQKMIQRGIFYISKYHPSSQVYDAQSGQRLDLLVFLKGKKQSDIAILVGARAQVPMRLVAQKLPAAVARQKRRKARQNRHAKAKHSEAYMELLGWVIFVTNVPKETLTAREVLQLYRLRWFIEIMFKAWKSCCHFQKILQQERMSFLRTQITIYLLLIQVSYWSLYIYQYIKKGVAAQTHRPLSILKYFDLLHTLFDKIQIIRHLRDLDPVIPQFAIHATHEARLKRRSLKERFPC